MKLLHLHLIACSLFLTTHSIAQITVTPLQNTYPYSYGYGNNNLIYPQYPGNNLLYAQNQCKNQANFSECMSKFGFTQIPNSNTFTYSNNNVPNLVIPNKNTPDYLLKNACTPANLNTCGNGNQIIIRK